jgi:hypothetical protein
MNLDFRNCKSPEDVERVMASAKEQIATHRRVLTGFAHFDRGEKVPGCDCCHCSPASPDVVTQGEG